MASNSQRILGATHSDLDPGASQLDRVPRMTALDKCKFTLY